MRKPRKPSKPPRRKGEGTVERLPSGRWRARLPPPKGTPKLPGQKRDRGESRLFDSEQAAHDWLAARRLAGPASAMTLGAWLDEWRAARAADGIELSTLSKQDSLIRRLIRPYLAAVPLRKLDQRAITAWLTHIHRHATTEAGGPVSASERRGAASVLRAALNAAAAQQLVPPSPFAGVKLPRVDRAEWVPLDRGQVARLLAAADALRWGGPARLWVDAGCRVGELLALKWGDYDPATRTLTIRRAVCVKTGRLKPTKTRQVRRVTLSPQTAARLAPGEPDAPILPRLAGGMRSKTGHRTVGGFQVGLWRRTHKLAGLPPAVTGRSVRHATASILISSGVNVLVVARRLGHRDPAMTLRVYGHLLPGDADTAAAVMGAVIDECTDAGCVPNPNGPTDGPRPNTPSTQGKRTKTVAAESSAG